MHRSPTPTSRVSRPRPVRRPPDERVGLRGPRPEWGFAEVGSRRDTSIATKGAGRRILLHAVYFRRVTDEC